MTFGESRIPARCGEASMIGSSAAADKAAAQEGKHIELVRDLHRQMDRIQPTVITFLAVCNFYAYFYSFMCW